ncbi:ShlB/FhaC/HecB family hemolysin secretion/activation protein, partial [Burkholderia sp. BE17]|uniref:ShlB/FhaC/HecB family hemolysin secretion/activation protein n=1 Tax=Burkholderia sp. BE17 TaxID=2656644 RepID=UPI002AB19862
MQHRDIVGYEFGIAHRQYIGDVVLDGSFAWRASLPGLSSNSGTVVGTPDFDGKTQVELASVSAQVPFKIGSQTFSYQFGWNMQNARTPLAPSDYFTIGTRYAVRGFDQQLTLAAESGWVVSNELDWYVPTPVGTQALYAGVDAGRVRGPAAQYLLGETLVGAVVGVRGNLAPKNVLGAALNYDVSLGLSNQSDLINAAQAASEAIAKQIGSYADRKRESAQKNADSATDPTLKAQYQQEADSWAEGGDNRVALHIAGGALTGGLTGGGLGA